MKRDGEITARPDEFVGARDAARGFSNLVSRLSSGDARLFVIVYRNRPRAVLLSLAEYERLLAEVADAEQRRTPGRIAREASACPS